MDNELQAGKNFAWSLFSQFFLRILGLVFFVLMSHLLGDVGMGQYNFISSFVIMWFIFLDFGASGHLYREWSKSPKTFNQIEDDFFLIFTLRLITVLILFVPFFFVNYFSNFRILLALITFFVSTFLATYINLADAFFQSASLFKYPSIRQVFEKVVIIILGSVGLFFWPRVETVFFAILLSQIFSLFYYFKVALPFKFRLIFDGKKIFAMIKKGLPFLFITLFASLYARVDIVMLRYLGNFEAVGWYGTAYKFLEVAGLFTAILFMPSIFPALSSMWNDVSKRQQFTDFFYRAMRIMFSYSLIITLFFIFFAPPIISIFFPASFMPSVLALRILILVQIVATISLLFNNLLIIQRREYFSLFIVSFGLILNIILNLILIPRYSLYGAAWATVIAEVFNLLLLQHFSVWEKDKIFLAKILCVSFINMLILFGLKYGGQLNNYYFGILLCLINIWLLFRLRIIVRDDLIFFFNPIRIKLNTYFNQSEI
ncbi:MAG: flippase [Candidatus Magasanikbacteria bacterium]|jgi:O-antigen/teichoic acid export membrane protein